MCKGAFWSVQPGHSTEWGFVPGGVQPMVTRSYGEAVAAAHLLLAHYPDCAVCQVTKCGGVPLQCCVDGTVEHFVYRRH